MEPSQAEPSADRDLRPTTGDTGSGMTEQTNRHLARAVSGVLRVGVLTSACVIAAGTVVTFLSAASRASARRSVPQLRRGILHPAGWYVPHTLGAVVKGVGQGSGPALVMLGLLLLIATPVLRVMVSVIGFTLERDRRFILITLVVLTVLIGSFAVGS
jgi:uncharacterized membrane protein